MSYANSKQNEGSSAPQIGCLTFMGHVCNIKNTYIEPNQSNIITLPRRELKDHIYNYPNMPRKVLHPSHNQTKILGRESPFFSAGNHKASYVDERRISLTNDKYLPASKNRYLKKRRIFANCFIFLVIIAGLGVAAYIYRYNIVSIWNKFTSKKDPLTSP